MAVPRSSRGRAREIVRRLSAEYPGNASDLCALRHTGPFQLLVATILSAQSTDERVNIVTPELFAAFPTAEALAAAPMDRLEKLIYSTGFFRAKARSLVGMARGVTELYGGTVPSSVEELTQLPGVGRKTANVVRSVAFDLPGFPVDTHVGRLVRRLGLSEQTDPEKVEAEVTALVPPEEWGTLSVRLILHGRRVCLARRPRCTECLLADICPSADVPVRSRAAFVKERQVPGKRPVRGMPEVVGKSSTAGRRSEPTTRRSGSTKSERAESRPTKATGGSPAARPRKAKAG